MSNARILLLGAGGHARACIDVIEQEGRFSIGGLLGLPSEMGATILGHTVLGTDAGLAELLGDCGNALVTVGQIKTPEVRMALFRLATDNGFELPSIVSPRAYVSPHASIGAGSMVMHGAVVNAGARVGRNCIVNSLALVEHDADVADHCHIATGAKLNSAVRVGAGTFVGSGATVRQGITIGERCVIAMGTRVLADCESNSWIGPERQRR